MTDGLEGETIAELEAEVKDKERQVRDLTARVGDLMALEAADGRPRAGEIHELRQTVQVLKWEIQHLRAGINRQKNPWY